MSSDPQTATERARTPLDELADAHVRQVVALSPMTATFLGLPGGEDRLDDLSPAGIEASVALTRATLAALDEVEPVDAVDEVTLAAMRERLGLDLERHDALLVHGDLNVIASPLQGVRDVFDLMPTDTDDDWATIARRLRGIPDALAGYTQSLAYAAERGVIAPQRQVRACIEQCATLVADDGYFAALPMRAPDAVRDQVAAAAGEAAAAYGRTGDWLRENLLDRAPEADACGLDAYRLHSRYFLGAEVDLAETYAWGQAELARITAEMAATADRIKPGATVAEAIAALDADPAYLLEGTEALQAWMQVKADEVIAGLADTHFDIPEPVRRIECCIAPTQTGGIYYTGPSDDFSRPGRMWWSVPKGVTRFGTWRELTTVYHEGVPGHHLQVGQTVYRSALLNSWRRLMCWTSGHGEGWALYSERLMDELGWLDDPGNRMGLLDGQSLRAARVVLDIGVHCGFEAPAEVGGGDWTYDKAWQFLTAHANMDEAFLRFELDRYLGWPGQAPSYKIGERLWQQLRDESAARRGEAFDLKDFHRRALDVGSVGLDVLRQAVLGA